MKLEKALLLQKLISRVRLYKIDQVPYKSGRLCQRSWRLFDEKIRHEIA